MTSVENVEFAALMLLNLINMNDFVFADEASITIVDLKINTTIFVEF